jgi:hypothetical protein
MTTVIESADQWVQHTADNKPPFYWAGWLNKDGQLHLVKYHGDWLTQNGYGTYESAYNDKHMRFVGEVGGALGLSSNARQQFTPPQATFFHDLIDKTNPPLVTIDGKQKKPADAHLYINNNTEAQ